MSEVWIKWELTLTQAFRFVDKRSQRLPEFALIV
jgi:hypothetical protein